MLVSPQILPSWEKQIGICSSTCNYHSSVIINEEMQRRSPKSLTHEKWEQKLKSIFLLDVLSVLVISIHMQNEPESSSSNNKNKKSAQYSSHGPFFPPKKTNSVLVHVSERSS